MYIKGVGPHRAGVLAEIGIESVSDLLRYYPRRYLDRTSFSKINTLRVGEETGVVGRVESFGIKRTRRRTYFQLNIRDDTGYLQCIWFNAISWISDKFQPGNLVAVFGKVGFFEGLQITHPDFDILDDGEDPVNTGKILAQYSGSTALKKVGLESRAFRRIIRTVFKRLDHEIPDTFTPEFLNRLGLVDLDSATRNIHQPESQPRLNQAIHRLKFDEHFYFQLLMALRRQYIEETPGRQFPEQGPYVKGIYDQLPFSLTAAQIRVMREIRKDLSRPRQMNRLLQGDVGSGKTVVAMLTAALVIGHGAQTAVLVPTEILAEQHYAGMKKYCDLVDIRTAILKGGMKEKERTQLLGDLRTGAIQLIVGTHALLQEDVEFHDLGLIIVDEQHRFGVRQRKTLISKGNTPDLLAMTATPIPRTLAITYHGDMDVSVIDELPGNRQPVTTRVVKPEQLPKVTEFARKELTRGRQVFVIFPLIDDSENLDLKAAESGYQQMQKEFGDFSVGFIHGRMKPEQREEVMQAFSRNDIHLLVSTTVVEVGIDIPNATVMIVENAERFGLAQLHQLRGRIGRGTHKSWCILIQRKRTEESDRRLKIMARTANGFEIFDEDLKIRGPGEFFGTQQHGFARSRLVDLINDTAIIRLARKSAFDLIADDPHLRKSRNKGIRTHFIRYYKDLLEFINID